MNLSVVDSDMLSEILKRKNPQVLIRAEAYFQQFEVFVFSAVTWYEIVRGLRAAKATTKLQLFEDFVRRSTVLLVTDRVLDLAADLWVEARGLRHRSCDADLLIAASALDQGATLVTGNHDHFAWIPGLTVEDWRDA
jgi:tRNA(fMet)-specific endonuclease VapC